MNTYTIGQKIRITGTFTDIDGAAIDPDAVLFELSAPPNLPVTTYTYGVGAELVKDSVGVYYIDVDLPTYGEWRWRMYSTGTGQAAAKGSARVERL